VIPAEFDYHRAQSVDDAAAALAAGGSEAKLIAGGHSLVPLMKLRLAAPTLLVDIGRLEELRGVERANGGWAIGGGTRHADLQDRDDLGVVARAAASIADQQVRNRGTIGGSLAHGDPASDLPGVLLASEGEVRAKGSGGERTIAASELFRDYLTTSLAQDEVITSIRLPSFEDWGWGYEKYARRAEDWAMVGVCALVKGSGGECEDVRIGLTNMGSTPLRAGAAEDSLRGGPLDSERIAAAADLAADGTDPPGDLNATADYKRHLARVLTRRALTQAAGIGG
jgi:aerobic carbon-monoxide dehydrogenase medium subunit